MVLGVLCGVTLGEGRDLKPILRKEMTQLIRSRLSGGVSESILRQAKMSEAKAAEDGKQEIHWMPAGGGANIA
jgi:hypothetical protein